MIKTIMPRFRDLVTPSGGSISEHRRIAETNGRVWWSWWKRQQEKCPEALFAELYEAILSGGKPIPAFAFDAGSEKFYSTTLQSVAVAPEGGAIRTPDPKLTPEFCHRGEYAAWFLYGPLSEITLEEVHLEHDSFPTNSDLASTRKDLVGRRITNAKELRLLDTTLYVVRFLEKPPNVQTP